MRKIFYLFVLVFFACDNHEVILPDCDNSTFVVLANNTPYVVGIQINEGNFNDVQPYSIDTFNCKPAWNFIVFELYGNKLSNRYNLGACDYNYLDIN